MKTIDYKLASQRARVIRDERKLTQLDMAKKLGVSPAMVSHYETGRYPLPPEISVRLARIGKVSVSWVFGLTNKRKES